MILEQIAGSTPYYYHADQLGSVRALTDGSGAVANTYTYDAYGNATASTGTTTNPVRYSGAYRDSESGLYYLRARYYDPASQQFLSRDPLLARTEQAYAYAGGSPLNYTDPSGFDLIDPESGGSGGPPGGGSIQGAGGAGEGSGVSGGGMQGSAELRVAQGAMQAEIEASQGIERVAATERADAIAEEESCVLTQEAPASTPIGRRGSELKGTLGRWVGRFINGRWFTGHALDQMQARGFMPSVVENTIQEGISSPGNKPGTTLYKYEEDIRLFINVVTNQDGDVMTIFYSRR
jgi:RHS repeat-associated protein